METVSRGEACKSRKRVYRKSHAAARTGAFLSLQRFYCAQNTRPQNRCERGIKGAPLPLPANRSLEKNRPRAYRQTEAPFQGVFLLDKGNCFLKKMGPGVDFMEKKQYNIYVFLKYLPHHIVFRMGEDG